MSAKRQILNITDDLEQRSLKDLENRQDFKALRIKKLLSLPDLSRKPNSPVKYIADAVSALPRFKDFDIVDIPKIMTVKNNFDIMNFPMDHPSRSESDTYYLNKDTVLRTQTTGVWPFYLTRRDVRERLEKNGEIGALCYGIVFRKDEIDRNHFPAFHQIDGLYLVDRSKKELVQQDLKDVLVDIAQSVYGKEIECVFLDDNFPYTRNSLEMDIKWKGQLLEILGAGLVQEPVLDKLGIDSKKYNGWAFGFGLDRLAMIKNSIPDIRVLWSDDPRITSQFKDINSQYKEVSKYPPTERDIAFVVDKSASLNHFFEIVRHSAGNLIEEVKLGDTYENEQKFGKGKVSYMFRITYRSPERTLTNEEVNVIQDKIREKTAEEMQAVVR